MDKHRHNDCDRQAKVFDSSLWTRFSFLFSSELSSSCSDRCSEGWHRPLLRTRVRRKFTENSHDISLLTNLSTSPRIVGGNGYELEARPSTLRTARQGKHSAGNPDCLGESSDGKTGASLRLFINNGSDGVHRMRRNLIGLFVKMRKEKEKKKKKAELSSNGCVGKRD